MRRTLAVAGLSGALLIGGAAGVLVGNPIISGAQDGTTTTTPGTPAPADAPAGDAAEHGAWITDALAPLVADGTITQAQADAVSEALQAAGPAGRGHGPMGEHGGGMGRGVLGAGLDAAAEALGLTTDELRTQLQDGTSLGAIADAAGVDRQAVVDAIVGGVEERVADAVTDGKLTQEEADARLA
ncbi:MAG: hypothetical protein AB7W59_11850, partial [Acidimicrobiia bacterium]